MSLKKDQIIKFFNQENTKSILEIGMTGRELNEMMGSVRCTIPVSDCGLTQSKTFDLIGYFANENITKQRKTFNRKNLSSDLYSTRSYGNHARILFELEDAHENLGNDEYSMFLPNFLRKTLEYKDKGVDKPPVNRVMSSLSIKRSWTVSTYSKKIRNALETGLLEDVDIDGTKYIGATGKTEEIYSQKTLDAWKRLKKSGYRKPLIVNNFS